MLRVKWSWPMQHCPVLVNRRDRKYEKEDTDVSSSARALVEGGRAARCACQAGESTTGCIVGIPLL